MFIICDDDIRLSRRILRDIKERGRDPEGVLY
jgi:uridine kinase